MDIPAGFPRALALRRIKNGVPYERAITVWELKAPTVSEGVVCCKKCGSKRVFERSMQTRSADEGMTIFYTCSVCSYNWRS